MALALLVLFGLAWPVLAQHVIFQDGFESVIEPDPDNNPPVITSTAVTVATVGQPYGYTVTATDADNDPLTFSLTIAPAGMTIGAANGAISWTPASAGAVAVTVQVADGRGGLDSQTYTLTVTEPDPDGPLPPDPATIAPPHDPTVATNLHASTEFLYTGNDPVQRGVAAGTIDPQRVAVIRGRVLDSADQPLARVLITIKGHPEFGWTLSRADGWFDMVVNGGAPLVVDYRRSGYLPVQRLLETGWQQWSAAPEVVMIGLDPNVTIVNLATLSAPVVASGSVETDVDGARQAHALFRPETTAELVMPDGSTQAINTLSVRATEYTVGPRGAERMPAELPLMTGYTYAVELSVDEAIEAGAASVRFSRSVPLYVDNFLGFPVGTPVPLGYYDRESAQWASVPDGRVIGVVGITAGMAELDINGDGEADDAAALTGLGIDEAERIRLAELYAVGDSLWRALVEHFTPYDCNWPYAPPPDAVPPRNRPARAANKLPTDDPCNATSSIIECQNQVLGERIDLAGTSFSLHYRSDRTPGRGALASIPVTPALVGSSMIDAIAVVDIAGRKIVQVFDPEPGQEWAFQWDGKDIYGRQLYGSHEALVTIMHRYPLVYTASSADFERNWARAGDSYLPVERRATTVTLRQRYRMTLRYQDARGFGLAGWTLSDHHLYEPIGRSLLLGNGERRRGDGVGRIIEYIAGGYDPVNDANWGVFGIPATEAYFWASYGFDIGPDGSMYFVEGGGFGEIHRIDPEGILHRVAGNYDLERCDWETETLEACGVGGPASESRIGNIWDLALAPDGTIYFIEDFAVVLSIEPDGILRHVGAITDDSCWDEPGDVYRNCALEGVATDTYFYPFGLDVGPDGDVYVADLGSVLTVGRIGRDGMISTVAGTIRHEDWDSDRNCATEGTLALRACMAPLDVAVGPDRTVYVLDELLRHTNGQRVFRILAFGADGRLRVAFDERTLFPDSRASALRLHAGEDGMLYLTTTGVTFGNSASYRVVQVDPQSGSAVFVAGTGQREIGENDIPALASTLRDPGGAVLGPDGMIYVTDHRSIRRIGPPVPGFDPFGYLIASEDGGEIYQFDHLGRHLSTRDALNGTALLTFEYDDAGRLTAVVDVDGRRTTILRDGGAPTGVSGPFGHSTVLVSDTDGWLAGLTGPDGTSVAFGYQPGGLLTSVADQLGQVTAYTYDDAGRLTRSVGPEGGEISLALVEEEDETRVTMRSAEGRETVYGLESLPDGSVRRFTTQPTGAVTEVLAGPGGSMVFNRPDGTVVEMQDGPDARFAMQAPLLRRLAVRTPGDIEQVLEEHESAVLADPSDPFSLVELTQVTSLNGNSHVTHFDRPSLVVTTTSPAGRQFIEQLDDRLRAIASFEGPDADPTLTAYGDDGLVTAVSQGDIRFQYSYDSLGRLAEVENAMALTTGYGFDDADRITALRLPSGRLIEYEYDAGGRLNTVTMPSGTVHELGYTPVGLPASYTTPAGQTLVKHFNLDKQIETSHLAGGRITTWSYDTGGRPVSLVFPEAAVDFDYVGATERISRIRRASTLDAREQAIEFDYDGHLMTTVRFSGDANGEFAYRYGSDFLIAGITLDGGQELVLERDSDGILTRAGDFELISLGAAGRPTTISDGTATVEYRFNGTGSLAGRTHTHGNVEFYELELSHRADGRIAGRTETIAGASAEYAYGYDVDGQLVSVTRDGALVEQYAYDLNGNRTLVESEGLVASASHDTSDRLLTQGDLELDFDADGFMARRGDASLTYDASGALLAVVPDGGDPIEYGHDGLGRRVARASGLGAEQYLYGNLSDSFQVSASRDTDGILTWYHYDDAGLLFALERDGARYYVATDQVGSPRVVVDGSGTVVKVRRYDAWGRTLQDSNPAFRLAIGFAGGLEDPETGLLRFGFRDYDPLTARWTTRDPLLYGGGQANLYAYAHNDPINLRDPSGLFCIGGTAYRGYGGGGKICVTTSGVSICGEVGLGAGGGVDIRPFDGLAKRSDADYVKAAIKAKCGPISLGFEVKLDDCGELSKNCQAGIGDLDLCKGKYKFKRFEKVDDFTRKHTTRVIRTPKGSTSCKAEGKLAAALCWSSDW